MDHLSKQQLILLALLVSFVTSLATGIFTVSLMSQAPQGVVQTINQVIEKTIQVAGSPSANFGTVAIKFDDQIANAVSSVSSSIIPLAQKFSPNTTIGLGLTVTKNGTLMTDASLLLKIGDEVLGTMPDGTQIMFAVISRQPQNGVIFLRPETSNPALFSFLPITFSSDVKLGQTILSLSMNPVQTVSQGIVTLSIIPATSTPVSALSATIGTNIEKSKVIPGSPLFDPSGEVVGMYISLGSSTGDAQFYPVTILKATVPADI